MITLTPKKEEINIILFLMKNKDKKIKNLDLDPDLIIDTVLIITIIIERKNEKNLTKILKM